MSTQPTQPSPAPAATTQARFSLRAVVRTVVQVVIPGVIVLGVLVPQAIDVVLEGYGESLPPAARAWLLGAGALVAATAGVIARLMALPAVEAFLRSTRFLSWLAAAPGGSKR